MENGQKKVLNSKIRGLFTSILMFTMSIILLSCVQTPTRSTQIASLGVNNSTNIAPPSKPRMGKRVALVIGNNRYTRIKKLDNPINDATDVSAKFKNLGFDTELKTDLNKVGMETAVREFSQRAQNAKVALVYFSGHGFQVHGENILAPIDLDQDKGIIDERGGISANFVQKVMQDATSGTKVLLLDACRNDPYEDVADEIQDYIKDKSLKSKGSKKQRGQMRTGLAPITPIDEFFVSYATAAGTTASDGDGSSRNSPYTAALLKHIEEPAPIESLFKKVRETVKRTTTPPQIPAEYTSLVGDFCFKDCGVEIPESSNTCHINIGTGIYEGECENGKANGQGVQRYKDGEYYTGEFKDNLRDGQGTQYLTDGTEISGLWQRGRLISGN